MTACDASWTSPRSVAIRFTVRSRVAIQSASDLLPSHFPSPPCRSVFRFPHLWRPAFRPSRSLIWVKDKDKRVRGVRDGELSGDCRDGAKACGQNRGLEPQKERFCEHRPPPGKCKEHFPLVRWRYSPPAIRLRLVAMPDKGEAKECAHPSAAVAALARRFCLCCKGLRAVVRIVLRKK
jgi:hypothetical protein